MFDINEKSLIEEYIQRADSSTDVLEALCTIKKEKVPQLHPYTITAPKSSNSRWQTYVVNEDSHTRVKITSESERTLYDKLYKHYYPAPKETLESFYPLWFEKRKNENVNLRTLKRNQNH